MPDQTRCRLGCVRRLAGGFGYLVSGEEMSVPPGVSACDKCLLAVIDSTADSGCLSPAAFEWLGESDGRGGLVAPSCLMRGSKSRAKVFPLRPYPHEPGEKVSTLSGARPRHPARPPRFIVFHNYSYRNSVGASHCRSFPGLSPRLLRTAAWRP